jgi:hypothetical protein
VKEKFGTRAKLIDAIADLEKRTKDEGYKTRLNEYPVPRLWDMWQSATKRSSDAKKAAEPKTAKKPAKKAAAPKKKTVAAAKKTSAKKKSSSKKKG